MTNPQNQDDQMPDDMYDDLPEESYEETEDVGEAGEWEDDALAQDGGEQEQKPKKKSSMFNIIVIVLAVVVGGGILLTQFGGGASAPQETADSVGSAENQAPIEAAAEGTAGELTALQGGQPEVAAPETVPAATDVPQPSQGGGFMNDPSLLGGETPSQPAATDSAQAPVALPDSGPSLTAPPAAEVAAPAPALMDAAPAVSAPQPAEALAQPDVAPIPSLTPITPVSDFPSVDVIKKADNPVGSAAPVAVPAPVVEEAPAMQEPVTMMPTAARAVSEDTSAEAQKKLDDALAKIQELEANLDVARKQADAQAAAVAKVEDLQQKIGDLEQKLSRAESSRGERIAPASASQQEEEVAPAVSRPTAAAEIRWELRSAQPGTAMIARKGQDDVVTVGVGDTLSGIGRITAIEQSPEGWVVVGTQGRIAQ
jgi:hypothetical protein